MGTLFSQVSTHGCLNLWPKTGASAYTEKPFVHLTHIHMNYRIIKKGGGVGAYTEMGAYSEDCGVSKQDVAMQVNVNRQ